MVDTVADLLGGLWTTFEYAGTVAFAISGALLAGRKRMDLVGVVVLGVIVAVGGGTLRDLLLGLPVAWLQDPVFVVVASAVALATVPARRWALLDLAERVDLIRVSDAAGMAAFVITGTSVALTAGADAFSAVIVGVVAGVGGGLIRDVLANQVPDVLANGEPYATAALAGAALYVLLLETDLAPVAAVWVALAVVLAIRLFSLWRGWALPAVDFSEPDAPVTPRPGA